MSKTYDINTTQNEIIRTMLGCSMADVEFICELLEDFEVDFSDAWNNTNPLERSTNNVIHEIYEAALSNTGIKLCSDEYSIFTNFLDSHLCIINTWDEHNEVHDKEELEFRIRELTGEYVNEEDESEFEEDDNTLHDSQSGFSA